MSENKETPANDPGAKVAQPPAGGPTRYVVARVDEIPEGERLLVDVGGRGIGIFRINGEFHAILQRCPHAGGPLCQGPLLEYVYADRPGEVHHDPDKKFLSCPWHGWLFDLKTGQSWWDPRQTRARRFPVSVEHGDVIAEATDDTQPGPGPYVIERFPVSVEDDYLVVTMRPRGGTRAPTDASI